ncbi:SAV_915 family protein [Streptomyces sp. NPDC005892]|uniref:SAV_915 family protein n=1 Tax=Streptomyces sp. NPDC005892 TaxID=3155593 RepID=UPI0033EFD425
MESALPDSDPLEPVPAGPLFVPVRPGSVRCPSSVRALFFRTPLGARTAVGFTSEQRLVATLGTGQQWVRLCETALRALAAPLGVPALTVDPPLSARRAADPHLSVPPTAAQAAQAAPAAPDAPALVRHGR